MSRLPRRLCVRGPVGDHTSCAMVNDLGFCARHRRRITATHICRPAEMCYRYFPGAKWSQAQILSARPENPQVNAISADLCCVNAVPAGGIYSNRYGNPRSEWRCHKPSPSARPSTADLAVSSLVCPYTSPVIAMELCPSRSATALICTPASSQPTAAECRRVCTPTSPTPADLGPRQPVLWPARQAARHCPALRQGQNTRCPSAVQG
jgi:hypothetical protein